MSEFIILRFMAQGRGIMLRGKGYMVWGFG
jgi:hypothetical protein